MTVNGYSINLTWIDQYKKLGFKNRAEVDRDINYQFRKRLLCIVVRMTHIIRPAHRYRPNFSYEQQVKGLFLKHHLCQRHATDTRSLTTCAAPSTKRNRDVQPVLPAHRSDTLRTAHLSI